MVQKGRKHWLPFPKYVVLETYLTCRLDPTNTKKVFSGTQFPSAELKVRIRSSLQTLGPRKQSEKEEEHRSDELFNVG